MDSMQLLAHGFAVALSWQNLALALVGCFLGTLIGALPGLGPSNGVAILIPVVFSMGLGPTPALILLTSVYYGAMYGGRISSILLNIPGDEPAIMTTLDGYPMARKGQAGEALAISGIASFVGAFFATWGLVFLAPQLVKVALLFGPAEYFGMFVLAFATLGGVTSGNQAKSAFAAAIGLALALVGVDGQTGVPRFSFGNVHFYDGIDFLIAIVGMFALSEVFVFIEERNNTKINNTPAITEIGRTYPPLSMLKQTSGSMGRGSTRGGQQCRRRRCAHPHVGLGRAGFGHHRRLVGHADVPGHHTRPASVSKQSGRGVGVDCLVVHRQLYAVGLESAHGGPFQPPASHPHLLPDASSGHDLFHRHLCTDQLHLRRDVDGCLWCDGLVVSQTQHSIGSSHSGYSVGATHGKEPATCAEHFRWRPVHSLQFATGHGLFDRGGGRVCPAYHCGSFFPPDTC
jgi:hypothetical protein